MTPCGFASAEHTASVFTATQNTVVISSSEMLIPIYQFYFHWSVYRESMSIIVQQDATMYSLLYFCKLFYMFQVVTPPIIRSTCNCNYSIWHWSKRLCYLPLWWCSWDCSSNCTTTAEGGKDVLTSARFCN